MKWRPLELRFWEKVDKTSDCWLWTAAKDTSGYGTFAVTPTSARGAHRISYELSVGPIPEGMQLDHLCRVRLCVNPAHLEVVTLQENHARRRDVATHCPSGHAFDEANSARTPAGYRYCRTCRSIASRKQYARKKAAA